jgi:hypothetical protein
MKKYLINLFEWLKGSADNDPGGASSKKLTGFFCFSLVGILTLTWCTWAWVHDNWSLLEYVITSLQLCGLGALGINSNEKIKLTKKDDTGSGKEA